MAVSKADIVDAVAASCDITKAKAGCAVNAVFDCIVESLKKDEKVTVVGFGTFEARMSKARMGRDPRTGASIHIPAKKVPKFKAGKTLKDELAAAPPTPEPPTTPEEPTPEEPTPGPTIY
ncbi:MAG: HU family DNA-binding protein [Candidatus Coatesbacteria bacterium]|nr:MAG: HU family DNA-binding protein [Candidatus Coatesbacteria bacterium]